MERLALISHLERFASGADRSIQWAKDAESLLDDIKEWGEVEDELQDSLALYRPGGGAHLVGEVEMEQLVRRVLAYLKSK